MSARFKTEHYEMVLKAGDMERCLQKLAWHLEEPRVGQSYPNYYVAQLASKFVKVVLSGAGETNCLQVTLGGTTEQCRIKILNITLSNTTVIGRG